MALILIISLISFSLLLIFFVSMYGERHAAEDHFTYFTLAVERRRLASWQLQFLNLQAINALDDVKNICRSHCLTASPLVTSHPNVVMSLVYAGGSL